MKAVRERYLPLAERVLDRRGFKPERIAPLSGGKKGLVYVFCRGDSRHVLKLYRNPLKYLKAKRIADAVISSGVCIAPQVVDRGLLLGLWGFCGFVVEEFAAPVEAVDADLLEDFFARLSLFHSSKAQAVPKSRALKFWSEACRETVSRWLFCERRKGLPHRLGELVEDALLRLMPEWRIFSLCHRDIALSNAGLIGGRMVLFDWDRAGSAPPQFDLVQAVFSFGVGERENAFRRLYFDSGSFGEREEFERAYLFSKIFFLVKRMKRALKRGDCRAFSAYLEALKDSVNYNP